MSTNTPDEPGKPESRATKLFKIHVNGTEKTVVADGGVSKEKAAKRAKRPERRRKKNDPS